MTHKPLSHDELERFLEGELMVSRAAEVEAQLAQDAVSAQRLDEVKALRAQLQDAPAALFEVDLAARVDDAIDRGASAPSAKTRRVPFTLAGASVALALAASLLIFIQPTDDARPKSAPDVAPQDAWAGITAHRVTSAGSEVVTDSVRADDNLMFSFTNTGPTPFSHLAIFAVDESGAVFWYYPAYLDAQDNPVSIPARGGANVGLPDKVRHAFRPGSVLVYGVFTRAPVPVKTIEAEVKRWVEAGDWSTAKRLRLSIGDSAQHMLWLKVGP